MKKITLLDRIRYRLDNVMARGTLALLGLLFLVTALFVVVLALVVYVGGFDIQPNGSHIGLPGLLWMILLTTFDSGAIEGVTGTIEFVGAMLLVTFTGIFLISTLIGIINNGIQSRIVQLRKGRSFVVEEGHILILGWSPSIFAVITELAAANETGKKNCIVILADRDQVEMEDQIRERVGKLGKTRIVCRTGSPLARQDLEIVNPNAARVIIVIAPDSPMADSEVLKTVLALTSNPSHRKAAYHIVAEGRDSKNEQVMQMVGKDEVQFVVAADLISRITAQTCRQSGLSVVYTELLAFEGDEMYFKSEAALTGKTFAEAMLMYEDSALLGVLYDDGTVNVNPPMDRPLGAQDQIIAISENHDTIRLSGKQDYQIQSEAIQPKEGHPVQKERTLILGWNQRGIQVILELDNYVAPGSEITVVANVPEPAEALEATQHDLHNLAVTFLQKDTTDRRVLDSLNLPLFDHVIVLSYSDKLDVQRADAQTLITLLHLRDVREKTEGDFSIVSEMLDVRNRDLANVTRADDFIVSDRLVSLMLAQLAENPKLSDVFADLFDPEGAEI
jgi:voltage-gated potassium channel Kch